MQPRPETFRPARLLAYLPLLFPLALILPWLGDFPYPAGDVSFSDITISHYPAVVTLKRLILEYRQLPLWSPHLLSGAPLAANPLYSLFYPPAWLALVLPLPAGFNLLVALHLVWGGLGMLRLLQAEGLRREAALLGALSFAALPKLYAHYGAGHLTLLYAVPWTPWLLLAWKQAGLPVGFPRLRVGAGLVLGLIFLADPRWAAYAGLLWLGYALYRLPGLHSAGERWKYLGRLAVQLLLGLLVAAPLALPLLEYTRLSTRAQLTPADNLVFSLPAARLLGLLFPSLGGTHEFELYPGALVLLLAVLAFFWGVVRRRAGFWLLAAALSLAWALGDNLPGMERLISLPGLDLLRVPSRALFITGLALSALAAYAVHALLADSSPGKSAPPGRLGLPLAGLAFFAILLAAGGWAISGQLNRSFVWGGAFLTFSALWVGLRLRGRLSSQPWLIGCLALLVLDLGVAGRTAFTFRPADAVLGEKANLAAYLQAQPGPFRVYSPSYSLPQQVSARTGLELADGVDPLQNQAYASYLSQAAGVPLAGYSVTLPPFASGDPAVDNRMAVPDVRLLGILNVAYVASEFPLTALGLEWAGEFDGTRLYRNTLARPCAWLQTNTSSLGENILEAVSMEWTPNRIAARIDPSFETPAWLVFSEIAYPGWRAWIDGQPVSLATAYGLLRAVPVPHGAQEVVLRYQPASVFAGLALGGLGLIGVFIQGRLAGMQPQPPTRDQEIAR